jgi:hypothetical protein
MQFLSLTHYPTHGFIYTSEPAEKPFHPPAPASTPTPTPATPQPVNAAESQMVMTTVPPSSYGTLFQHFVYAAQPFWAHRLTMAVPAGVVYEVGDFRVRMGDVRQTYPMARVRGTVVEIEWRGPSVVESVAVGAGLGEDEGIDVGFAGIEEADIDAEYAATAELIREFWARLGFEGAREAILVPGVGREVKRKLRRSRVNKMGEEVTVPAGGEEQDPDPTAGADVARQYMEVLRFNR